MKCFWFPALAVRRLTWGFIFGPGNPNAAIASMLRPLKGFAPIWGKKKTKHIGLRNRHRSDNCRWAASSKPHRWIRDGIGCRKKSSSWQDSCNSICRRQQWQSFSFIWDGACRDTNRHYERTFQTCRQDMFGKKTWDKNTLHCKLGWLPYRSEISLHQHNHCSDITTAGINHTTPRNTAKSISPERAF